MCKRWLCLVAVGVLLVSGTSAHAQVTAGADPVEFDGTPDGWTNILYINEEWPFDFSDTGETEGVLTEFSFWPAGDRIDPGQGMITPLVAEPLVEDPETGDDYIIRAIGTTREAGEDWDIDELQTFPFHDTEQFVVQDGWVAGFLSSDPEGVSPDARSPVPYVVNSDVQGWLTGTDTAGSGFPAITLDEPIEDGDSGTDVDAYGLRLYQFQIVAEPGAGGGTQLKAGDADQSLEFNQLDLVMVQIAAKYLTGQPATWGEGDWDGAPGGEVGSPPQGDGTFDQLDIIAALNAGTYLTGPYAAVAQGGQGGDGQTSVIYDPTTGEMGVDAPKGTELTSINIDSAAGIFTGDPAQNLGGSFDNADNNIFKATFGDSFGSLSFGNVTQTGLSDNFVANDLTVVGSLAGGGDLGDVDLIYVPEPSTMALLVLGLAGTLAMRRRKPT